MLLLWFAAGLFLVCFLGGVALWWPTKRELDARGALGAGFLTAVATSGVVSLLFFSLQVRANTKQEALSEASQRLQSQLSREESRNLQLALTRDLPGVDLSNQNLALHDLSHKNMSGAVLAHTDLYGTRLNSSDLSRANLTLADLGDAFLRYANLDAAQLVGANLSHAYLDEAKLSDANFGVHFADEPDRVGVTRANLSHAALEDAQMQHDCLAQVNLQGAKLGGANLAGADLDGADLRGAQLIFGGLPVNLQGASLAHAKTTPSERSLLVHKGVVTRAMRRVLRRGEDVPADARTGHISGFFDGDTAYISGLGWIRLLGVTAPNRDWPYGPEALRFFKTFFGPSETVRYVLGAPAREPRWGNTGRWLVYAWNTSGGFLNEALLQNGLAVRGVPPSEANTPTPARIDAGGTRFSKVLNAAASFARYTGRGMWMSCPKMPA